MRLTRNIALFFASIAFGMLVTLACLAGCRGNVRVPTTNPVLPPAQAAIAHSEAAKVSIQQAKVDAPATAKPHLIAAEQRTDAAIASEREVVKAAEQQATTIERQQAERAELEREYARNMEAAKAESAKAAAKLAAEVKAEKAKREEAEQDRDEAKQRYHDAWLGGKTWRLIGWVTGIGAILTIAGLLLNAKTDWFVWVWDIAVGIIAGLFRAVFGIGGRIAGLFDKAKSTPPTQPKA